MRNTFRVRNARPFNIYELAGGIVLVRLSGSLWTIGILLVNKRALLAIVFKLKPQVYAFPYLHFRLDSGSR